MSTRGHRRGTPPTRCRCSRSRPADRRRARPDRRACPARPNRASPSTPMNSALSSVAIRIASSGEKPVSTRNSSSRCRLRPGTDRYVSDPASTRPPSSAVPPQQVADDVVADMQLGEVVGVGDVVQPRRAPDRQCLLGHVRQRRIVGQRRVLGAELFDAVASPSATIPTSSGSVPRRGAPGRRSTPRRAAVRSARTPCARRRTWRRCRWPRACRGRSAATGRASTARCRWRARARRSRPRRRRRRPSPAGGRSP